MHDSDIRFFCIYRFTVCIYLLYVHLCVILTMWCACVYLLWSWSTVAWVVLEMLLIMSFTLRNLYNLNFLSFRLRTFRACYLQTKSKFIPQPDQLLSFTFLFMCPYACVLKLLLHFCSLSHIMLPCGRYALPASLWSLPCSPLLLQEPTRWLV